MCVEEWGTFVLGDLCQITSSKRIFAEEYVDVGIPFYRSKEVIEKALGEDITLDLFIPNERFHEIKRNFGAPQKGDILISSVGNRSGIPYLVKDDDGDFYFKDGNVIWFKDFNGKLNSKYLSYWLKSSLGQNALDSIMIGSAQKALTIIGISGLSIALPHISVQEQTANILSSLDNKIEVNRRMNATLESMATAIFRQWFLDGEDIANWEEKPLDEVANFLNGLALQKFPAEGDDYLPVIKISQLRTNDTESADKASTNIPPQYIIEDGDILFSWSGSLVVVAWCGGKGALNQHLFKVTSEKYPKWFFYFWTKHHLADFQEIAAGKATTMGHIQRHHLKAAKVLVPSDKELKEMDKVMSPLLDKIILNNLESRTLASLRDSLLPKLMKGEVRVKV